LPDSLLGSAWPSMYSGLNVPLHYAGYVSMIICAGTVIATFFSDKITRRFGTSVVVTVSVIMTASSLYGFSFSSSYLLICFCAVPLGLGAGSLDAALNNYVALHYKARHMNWLHCFWGIGASIGPIIMSYYLIKNNSWNMGYRTIGIFQTCLIVVLFASLSLWRKNIPSIVSCNEVSRASEENKNARHPAGASAKGFTFVELFRTAGVRYVLAAFFFYCGVELTTGLWGSSYLVIEKNIPAEMAAQWISLYYFGITLGRFISGFLTIKFSNRQMIRFGQGLVACGIVSLMLPFDVLLLPGLFTIGLGCAPIFPSLIHETPKNFGSEKSQAIVGIQMASAYIGNLLIPPFFGQLASFTEFKFSLGFKLLPFFLGIVLVLMIIMIEILFRKVDRSRH